MGKNVVDTFTFNYSKRPDLINVDGDKILLWVKKIIKHWIIIFTSINMQGTM